MLQSTVGEEDFEYNVSAILSGHTQDVKFVKFHPSKDQLFSASYDNTIKCWEYSESVDDWVCIYTITGHKSTVWQLVFDPVAPHNFMCSCSQDKSWAMWDISSSNYINKGFIANSHLRSVLSIDWSSRDMIATVGADNRLNFYEISRESLMDKGIKNVAYN